jgi:hypothetical protein
MEAGAHAAAPEPDIWMVPNAVQHPVNFIQKDDSSALKSYLSGPFALISIGACQSIDLASTCATNTQLWAGKALWPSNGRPLNKST